MDQMKIGRDDFLKALDEVRPSFGVSEAELEVCVQNKIIPFSDHIEVAL
jgi:vesicle-fusing ATPase